MLIQKSTPTFSILSGMIKHDEKYWGDINMVANIRNMEIDNETQNGITAIRVYGESL